MPELLLELRSEEIPARMQAKAGEDLKAALLDALKSAGAEAENAAVFTGPRRLALTVQGLPGRTADVREVRKGPRTDAPKQAIEGFLKSVGLSSVDECEVKEDKKGAFLTAVKTVPGRPVGELVAEALPDILGKFPWPKSMRSGHGDLRWVRPLRSILCVFDGEAVAVEIAGLKAGDRTVGHRALSPASLRATTFEAYDAGLREARVMLRAEEREEAILHEATTLAEAQSLALVADDGLLKEVAGLVEWPFPRVGAFDEAFLALPDEVILTVLKNHQKCFALKDPKTGRLAAKFVYVANQEGADGGAAIRAGNERVVRARLNDARFFWDQDRKATLESRVERLKDVVFQAKLGTVAQKTGRVAALARHLAQFTGAPPEHAHRAALLAKADLVTDMVGEFPELQGLVGGWYAEADGEDAAVAGAIRDHYKPLGPSDAVPSEAVAVTVALADKLDTLAGFWAIDEKPTGSKDPFALRRAALGVIRLILEKEVRVGLLQAVAPSFLMLARQFDAAAMKAVMAQLDRLTRDARANRFATRLAKLDVQFGASAGDQAAARKLFETRAVELLAFFADRLKVALKDKGVRHDVIDAVFALGEDDIVLIVKRAEALQAFITTGDGEALLAAYARAANILRIEEKKDARAYAGPVDAALLQETAETALVHALDEAEPAARAAVEREDHEAAMRALASLRAPVDAFFNRVTVNAEDGAVRANRLNLLNRIRTAVDAVADFSHIGASS